MVDIDQLSRSSFLLDEPVPYHLQCGVDIKIHPILVKDSILYTACSDVLKIDKSRSGDISVIKMTYLEYLLNCLMSEVIEPYRMIYLIRLCLHEEDISIETNNGKLVLGIVENGNIKAYITSSEFADIRTIILHQNEPEFQDIKVNPSVEKMMNDYYRITSGGMKKVTLEEKIAFMGNTCSLNKKELLEMTYREFLIRFDLALDQIEYQINKPLEASGQVKFKRSIEHFIFKKEHDKIEEMFTQSSALENTINGVPQK